MPLLKFPKRYNFSFDAEPSSQIIDLPPSSIFGIHFSANEQHYFPLFKEKEHVLLGQPIAHSAEGAHFLSPASGILESIEWKNTENRYLKNIRIRRDQNEEVWSFSRENLSLETPSTIAYWLMQRGLLNLFEARPWGKEISIKELPRSIFVQGFHTLAFNPPIMAQVKGFEEYFLAGMKLLSLLCPGCAHLTYSGYEKDSNALFKDSILKSVHLHAIEGSRPAGNLSVAIHHIDPIKNLHDRIWAIDLRGVVVIGKMLLKGEYHVEQIIALAGKGIFPTHRSYYKTRTGSSIGDLIGGRVDKGIMRIIGHDPIQGEELTTQDYLPHNCYALILLLAHYFELYSPHFPIWPWDLMRENGEFSCRYGRPHSLFFDPAIYQRSIYMNIPLILLIKALMKGRVQKAVKYGLLQLAPEDMGLGQYLSVEKKDLVSLVQKGFDLLKSK